MKGCSCTFWHTHRGAMLADRTLPQLVIELRRLNDHLGRFQAGQQETTAPSKKEVKP